MLTATGVTGTTAIGNQSLDALTTGDNNTALGAGSMGLTTTGHTNVAVGKDALSANTTGETNVAIGLSALLLNTEGYNNVAMGHNAVRTNISGDEMTGVGDRALYAATGGLNTAFGYLAGYDITSGANNLCIGPTAGRDVSPGGAISTASNRIVVGNNSHTSAHIKIDWTVTSDERDKADITDFTHGLNYVNQLRPVNYVWDNRSDYKNGERDGTHKKDLINIGFLAQEIKAVETNLGIDNHAIVDTTDLDSIGMKYSRLIPVLVNAIQELSAEIEILKAK